MLIKKSQSAIEFIVVFGALLFFFVAFFVVINKNISEKNIEKERMIMQDTALDIQEEIAIASESSNGYSRNFNTPKNVLGKEYNANITGTFIYLSMGKFGIAYKIQNITGELIKGENLIRKENGKVYLNVRN